MLNKPEPGPFVDQKDLIRHIKRTKTVISIVPGVGYSQRRSSWEHGDLRTHSEFALRNACGNWEEQQRQKEQHVQWP